MGRMGGGWSPPSSHVVFEAGSWRDNRGSFISQTQWGKRHNGSHAESMPALHWAVHAGLKQTHASRSTPEKKEGWVGGGMTYIHTTGRKEQKIQSRERFFWWRHFQHVCSPFQTKKAASLACPSSTYLGCSRRWAQHLGDGRDRWERNVTGANPSPFFIQWFTFCFFYPPSPSTPEPWCHYSSVSEAVQTHLHRKALCISNSWATELPPSHWFTGICSCWHAGAHVPFTSICPLQAYPEQSPVVMAGENMCVYDVL